MTIVCPMCDRRSPGRSQRCECGFDFTTHEMGPMNERLRADQAVKQSRANRRIALGIALLLGGPIAGVVLLCAAWVFGAPLALGAGVFSMLVGGFGGAITLALGVRERHRLPRVAARELPAARIVP